MAVAALVAGITGIVTFLVAMYFAASVAAYWFPAAYFLLSIAHAGVRLGRKTHLVDIATAENRASYVAVSNTIIGVMLLLGGLFGAIASMFGAAGAILTLSIVALLAAVTAWQLDEAQ